MSEVERCFCGAGPEDRRSFAAGPVIRIRKQYLGDAAQAMAAGEIAPTAHERLEAFSREGGRHRSFCGKSVMETKCLLYCWAGSICDDSFRSAPDIAVGPENSQPKAINF